MRTPLGGRGFEFFAEDPVLTARLAVAYVQRRAERGRRGHRSSTSSANDSETRRWTYDARIAEHVLRELYLAPFEACVTEAGAMLVMAAYNRVNGARMTENPALLRDVLKDEWGFDGVVISDWHAARSTAATALAALDLSMPGPDGPWAEALVQAVDGRHGHARRCWTTRSCGCSGWPAGSGGAWATTSAGATPPTRPVRGRRRRPGPRRGRPPGWRRSPP